MKQLTRRYIWIVIVGAGIAVAVITAATFTFYGPATSDHKAEIQANAVEIISPDSKPYGKSYGEWAEAWWKWAQAEPTPNNPLFDSTGEKCNIGQTNENVWWGAGTTGGPEERKCTIPSSKAIFFPLLNTECSYLEDKSLNTYEKRKECAISGSKGAVLHLRVDGVEKKDLDRYWFVSEKDFLVELPANNLWGVEQGETSEVSAGYWAMLPPFSPGEHTLNFGGSRTDVVSGNTFATDVTYHLTVE